MNKMLRQYIAFVLYSEFSRKLENLENGNGHGKVIEHDKLAKSHGILWGSVMEFYQFYPQFVLNLYLFCHH